jgi:hypothetical protein
VVPKPRVAGPTNRAVDQPRVDLLGLPTFDAPPSWPRLRAARPTHWAAAQRRLDDLGLAAAGALHRVGLPAGCTQPCPGVGASVDLGRDNVTGDALRDSLSVVAGATQRPVRAVGVGFLFRASAPAAGVSAPVGAGLAQRESGLALHHPGDLSAAGAGLPTRGVSVEAEPAQVTVAVLHGDNAVLATPDAQATP